MTIDINELRRMAQAATPGPWIGCGPSFGESLPKYLNEVAVDREGDEDDGYSVCTTPIGLEEQCSDDMAFIAAANPAAVSELLDRLEAAEKAVNEAYQNWMTALDRNAELLAKVEAAEKERDNANAAAIGVALQAEALQAEISEAHNAVTRRLSVLADENTALSAKIAEMEKQEPYSYIYEYANPIDGTPVWRDKPGYWNAQFPRSSIPLYLAPGAKGEEK